MKRMIDGATTAWRLKAVVAPFRPAFTNMWLLRGDDAGWLLG